MKHPIPGQEVEGGEQILAKLVCASTKGFKKNHQKTVARDECKIAVIIKPVWAIPELERPNFCLPRILSVPAIPGARSRKGGDEGCLLQAGKSGHMWLY